MTYNTHPAERAALAYSKIGPEAAALNAQLNTARPYMLSGTLLSGAMPVGDHVVATPLMTALTSMLVEGLVHRYAPHAFDEVKTSAEKIARGRHVIISAQPQGAFATQADRSKSPRLGNVLPIRDLQASIGHKPNPSGLASASFNISAEPSLQFNSGNIRAGWIDQANGDLRRELGLPTVAEQRELKRRDQEELERHQPKAPATPPPAAKHQDRRPVTQGGGAPRGGTLAVEPRPVMSILDQANAARLLARHSPFRGAVGQGGFTNESAAQRFLARNPRFAAAALKMRGMGSV